MLKKYIAAILIIIWILPTEAAKVAVSDAQLVARNYYAVITNLNNPIINLIPIESVFGTEFLQSNIYLFKSENDNRYIFVAGSSASYPILGYTDEPLPANATPPVQLIEMLRYYKSQLTEFESENLQPTTEIADTWNALRSADYITNSASRSLQSQVVLPLLTTKWNQSPYYNSRCPIDSRNGYRSLTGCVATAMAQVMKYWNYPPQGAGAHSYNAPYAGGLSANFAATTYHWTNMPNNISSNDTDIAILMRHCGIAVNMNYGSDQSGAYVINAYDGSGGNTAEHALKSYFGYDQSSTVGRLKNNYSWSDWKQMLEFDLGQARPLIYAGFGSGGHCFVCDGEDASGNFHMNWGWGGGWNGYFQLGDLNPASRNYSNNQQAIFGLKPGNFSLHSGLTSNGWMDMRYSSNNAPAGYNLLNNTAYKLEAWIINYDSVVFTGDIAAMLLNANQQITDTLGVYHETNGKAVNATYNPLTFNIGSLHGIPPGDHYIQLFARKNASFPWKPISNGFYSNIEYFTFYPEDTLLNHNFNIPCSALWAEPFPFKNHRIDSVGAICIDNLSASAFNGKLTADIFDINGQFIKTFHTQNNVYIAGHDTYYPQGFIDSLSLSPGNYLMGIRIQPNGGQPKFIPMGNSDWTNPVTVTVVNPSMDADIYEVNDSESIATELTPVFVNDTVQIDISTSIYFDDDHDYFKINLPSTDTVQLQMKISDSNIDSTFNGRVMYNTKKESEGTYTGVYLSDTTLSLTCFQEGYVYIDIEPVFSGIESTYDFQIKATRVHVLLSEVDEVPSPQPLTILPNPSINTLTVTGTTPKTELIITDLIGETLFKIVAQGTTETIDVSKLPRGVYFLNHQKFIKQ